MTYELNEWVEYNGMSLLVGEIRDGKALLCSYTGYGRYPIVEAIVDIQEEE